MKLELIAVQIFCLTDEPRKFGVDEFQRMDLDLIWKKDCRIFFCRKRKDIVQVRQLREKLETCHDDRDDRPKLLVNIPAIQHARVNFTPIVQHAVRKSHGIDELHFNVIGFSLFIFCFHIDDGGLLIHEICDIERIFDLHALDQAPSRAHIDGIDEALQTIFRTRRRK